MIVKAKTLKVKEYLLLMLKSSLNMYARPNLPKQANPCLAVHHLGLDKI